MDIPTLTIGIATVVVTAVGGLAAVLTVLVTILIARRQQLGFTEWIRDLRAWASEAIDVLSEAIHVCGVTNSGSHTDEMRRCIYRLRAMIDRGRLFLPNQRVSEYGSDNPPAYRGYRHSALDPLVAAVSVLERKVDEDSMLPEAVRNIVMSDRLTVLQELQREFVSNIYLILAPDRYNKRIEPLIRGSYEELPESDEQVQALLPTNVPPGQGVVLARVVERIQRKRPPASS